MNIPYKEIRKYLNKPVFRLVSQVADEMNVECYVIGGYVRDIFLSQNVERYRLCGCGKRHSIWRRQWQKKWANSRK